MDWDRRPTRVSQLLFERLEGELLLYSPVSTRTFHLNEAAALIWDLCNGQRSGRAIVDLLPEADPRPEPHGDTEC